MRRNTIISILMAGLLAVSAAGYRSVPSDSELEKALEEGTITFEDAKSRGWVDDAWLEEHFPPMEAGSKIHSFPPFETTYLDGTPASSQLIEGTMCLVFFDSTQGDTVEKLREISGISEEMTRLGVPVLGIIMDEDLDGARETLSDLKFPVIVYNDEMRASLELYDDMIAGSMVSVFTKDGGFYSAWSSDCSAGWLLEGAEGLNDEG